MDIDRTTDTGSTDTTAYGGCRHRLQYDRDAKNPSAKKARPSRLIIVILIVVVLLLLGMVTLRYYKGRVHDIIGDGDHDANQHVANFLLSPDPQ